jgi:hypothetical protein
MIEYATMQDDRIVRKYFKISQQLNAFAVLEVGFQITERNPGLDRKVKLRIGDAKEFFQP